MTWVNSKAERVCTCCMIESKKKFVVLEGKLTLQRVVYLDCQIQAFSSSQKLSLDLHDALLPIAASVLQVSSGFSLG